MASRAQLSRHWALRALAGLGLACTFVAAVIVGVLLHADLPVSRHLASRLVQRALGTTLGGKIVLAPLEGVSFTHLAVPKAVLLDIYGHPVLELWKVRIDLALSDLFSGTSGGAIVVSH